MMKNQKQLAGLLLLLGAALYGLAGCGGAECGEGTEEQDGTCVPLVECGDGTRAEDGQCVVGDDGCGPNTSYNSETGTCMPAGGTCSEGTTFQDGQCVAEITDCGDSTIEEDGVCNPDLDNICSGMGAVKVADDGSGCVVDTGACDEGTELAADTGSCVVAESGCGDGLALSSDGTCVPTDEVCDEGTNFDADNGVCLPDATCKMGDKVLNGHCVSPVEKLADEADTSENENDDPNLGGDATELTVKDVGNTTVFKGTIGEPTDLDSDGEADQDVDAFKFDATAGQWFKIAVQSNGLPAPWFVVEGPNGWTRQGPTGLESDPARHLAIHTDGTYTVHIMPTATAANDDIGPIGNSEWGYVGSLEQLDPDSNPITQETVDMTNDALSGAFPDLSDNYYDVEGFSSGDLIELSVETLGDNAEGVLSIFDGDGSFISDIELDADEVKTMAVPKTSSGSFGAIVDWISMNGPDADYEINASKIDNVTSIGAVAQDSSETTSGSELKADETATYTFSVSSGQIIALSQTNAEDAEVDVTLLDSSGNEITAESGMNDAENPGSYRAPGYLYHYTESGGTFIVRAQSSDSEDLTDLSLEFGSKTPNDLGSGSSGDTLSGSSSESISNGQSAFHLFTLQDRSSVTATFSTDDSKSYVMYLKDTDFDRIGRESEYSGAKSVSLELKSVKAGVYLVEMRAFETIDSHSIEVELTQPPVEESEPNNSDNKATDVPVGREFRGEAQQGDKDVFKFTLSNNLNSGDVLGVGVVDDDSSSLKGADYSTDCKLWDSSGNVVDDASSTEFYGCVFFASDLSKGTYYFEYSNDSLSSVNYNGRLWKTTGTADSEPNDGSSDANTIETGWTAYGHVLANSNADPDEDYYELSLGNDLGSNEFLDVELGPEMAPRSTGYLSLRLLKPDGSGGMTEIDTDTGHSSSYPRSVESSTGLSQGTYYIHVHRNGSTSTDYNGRYSLRVNKETN